MNDQDRLKMIEESIVWAVEAESRLFEIRDSGNIRQACSALTKAVLYMEVEAILVRKRVDSSKGDDSV